MKKFAFVSRHVPTYSQMEIAKNKGIELVHVGGCPNAWVLIGWKSLGYMHSFYNLLIT